MREALRSRISELLDIPVQDLPITKVVGGVGVGKSGQFELGDPHELVKQAGWLLERIIDGATFKSADDIAGAAGAAIEQTRHLEARENADYWEPGFKPSTNPNYWEIVTAQADGGDHRRELNLLADPAVFALAAGAIAQSPTVLGVVVRTRNLRARGAKDPFLQEPNPPRFGLVPAQRARTRAGEIKLDNQGRPKADGPPHQRASAVLIAAAAGDRLLLYNPGSATLQTQPSRRGASQDEGVRAHAKRQGTGACELLSRPCRPGAPPRRSSGTGPSARCVPRSDARRSERNSARRTARAELHRLTPTVLDQADWADALKASFSQRDSWICGRGAPASSRRVVAVQVDEAIAGKPEGMRLHTSMLYHSSRGQIFDQEGNH